jgi:hypothetical protein
MKKAFGASDMDRGILSMAVRSYARHTGMEYEDAHRVMSDYVQQNPPPEEIGRRQRQLGHVTPEEARQHFMAALEKYQHHHHNLAPNFSA